MKTLPREIRIALGVMVALFVWAICAYVLPHTNIGGHACTYDDGGLTRTVPCSEMFPQSDQP